MASSGEAVSSVNPKIPKGLILAEVEALVQWEKLKDKQNLCNLLRHTVKAVLEGQKYLTQADILAILYPGVKKEDAGGRSKPPNASLDKVQLKRLLKEYYKSKPLDYPVTIEYPKRGFLPEIKPRVEIKELKSAPSELGLKPLRERYILVIDTDKMPSWSKVRDRLIFEIPGDADFDIIRHHASILIEFDAEPNDYRRLKAKVESGEMETLAGYRIRSLARASDAYPLYRKERRKVMENATIPRLAFLAFDNVQVQLTMTLPDIDPEVLRDKPIVSSYLVGSFEDVGVMRVQMNLAFAPSVLQFIVVSSPDGEKWPKEVDGIALEGRQKLSTEGWVVTESSAGGMRYPFLIDVPAPEWAKPDKYLMDAEDGLEEVLMAPPGFLQIRFEVWHNTFRSGVRDLLGGVLPITQKLKTPFIAMDGFSVDVEENIVKVDFALHPIRDDVRRRAAKDVRSVEGSSRKSESASFSEDPYERWWRGISENRRFIEPEEDR